MGLFCIEIDTPLGIMIAISNDKGINLLEFADRKNIEKQIQKTTLGEEVTKESNIHLDLLKKELKEYFSRGRKIFTVPLDVVGTDFQKEVWTELLNIPFGKTISYLHQAKNIGAPQSVRAVANANSMNKIAIIIPCHRVIGSKGTLTGYAGGLDKKQWLLNLEKESIF